VQPRLGGKKLYVVLKPRLDEAGGRIGRDCFFKVLGEKGLLLDPLPKAPRTTNSRHYLPVFSNQFKGLELTHPNQAWVSDITYIRTDEWFVYLSLITDAYSRKIADFHMTEENPCYENAKAERVNGILKQEYGLGSAFRTKQQTLVSVDQAVVLYTTRVDRIWR